MTISRKQVREWLDANRILYSTSGYSIFPALSQYYFRFDQQENLRCYTVKPVKKEHSKDIEARILTQCLLWGIEFREPLRA
ncbi:hypothetical protein VPHK479_0108 [Vibrio phage K479]